MIPHIDIFGSVPGIKVGCLRILRTVYYVSRYVGICIVANPCQADQAG